MGSYAATQDKRYRLMREVRNNGVKIYTAAMSSKS
jgi:predicted peroxiredoxin